MAQGTFQKRNHEKRVPDSVQESVKASVRLEAVTIDSEKFYIGGGLERNGWVLE